MGCLWDNHQKGVSENRLFRHENGALEWDLQQGYDQSQMIWPCVKRFVQPKISVDTQHYLYDDDESLDLQ